MIFAPQQSYSILVFLHTPPSEFTQKILLYNIDIMEKIIE